MPHVIDRLASLRVADVMARDVQTVGKNQTMSEVAANWVGSGLSSAPVVDELGHCVGVVTATDFVKRESRIQQLPEEGPPLVDDDNAQPYRCFPITDDFVSHHMTDALQTIHPGESLLHAARVMCAEHIHRLFVVDQQGHPVGVISTMDVVAATVNVVDEMNEEAQRGEG